MNSEINKIVGKRIKQYRKKEGLSQEELAFKASLHTTYIGQLERGEKNATLKSIEKISSSLKIPLEVIFKGVQEEFSSNEDQIAKEVLTLIQKISKTDLENIDKIIHYLLEIKT